MTDAFNTGQANAAPLRFISDKEFVNRTDRMNSDPLVAAADSIVTIEDAEGNLRVVAPEVVNQNIEFTVNIRGGGVDGRPFADFQSPALRNGDIFIVEIEEEYRNAPFEITVTTQLQNSNKSPFSQLFKVPFLPTKDAVVELQTVGE